MSWRFSAPFFLLAAVPALYYLVCPEASAGAIVLLLVGLTVSELVLPAGIRIANPGDPRAYRLVPVLYIPAQLSVTGWAIAAAGRSSISPLAFAELIVAVGVSTGVFGMLAAHEMVHSPERRERRLGGFLLTAMMYRHFRVVHICGHHRWAGTPRDAATARLSEGFYRFLARTVPQQFADAASFERRRCAKFRCGFLRNRVYHDVVIVLLAGATIVALAHIRGLLFYVGESVVAIVVLELFNYIAHYGLERARADDGRLEPPSDRHSWNSSSAIANLLIFNMGRHSDHHRRPASPYQTLLPTDEGAELPFGYAGSILLALCPPLWRRVMDWRVLELRAMRARPERYALDGSLRFGQWCREPSLSRQTTIHERCHADRSDSSAPASGRQRNSRAAGRSRTR